MTLDQEGAIRRLASEGFSHRAIARSVGVSHTLVGKVLRRPLAPVAPPRQATEPVAPLDASAAPITALDALAIVRELVADNRREHAACATVGDSQGAQRYSRTVATLMPVLARLERDTQSESDLFKIPRAEIAETMAAVEARVRAITDRPLLCAECSRALSVHWGTEGKVDGNGKA